MNIKLKNILSELLKEIGETHPVHKKINSKLLQIVNRGEEDEKYVGNADKGNKLMDKVPQETIDAILKGTYKMKEGEEQEYEVSFYVMQNDDDMDYDQVVKASSPEDAIEKVKKDAPSRARKFTAKLK
jgi:DNA-directed RNA polymerase delta subunit